MASSLGLLTIGLTVMERKDKRKKNARIKHIGVAELAALSIIYRFGFICLV
jgi:hypothetical protein